MARTGVYPVFENKFKIGTKGRASAAEDDMVIIAEMESFSISIDNTTEEWTPMEQEGWINRMVTGKGFSISMNGKRCIGDAGNDYVANAAWGTGSSCDTKFEWIFPDGGKLAFDCVLSVSNIGGGDSTNVGALEFEVLSHKKPMFTPAGTTTEA